MYRRYIEIRESCPPTVLYSTIVSYSRDVTRASVIAPHSRSNDEFLPFLALPIFMPLRRILQDVAAITAIVLNLYIFVSGLPKVSHSRSMLYGIARRFETESQCYLLLLL